MRTEAADIFERWEERGTRVAAAINVSPESFYSGSVRGIVDIAEAARRAEAAGAAMIDIGARSTAPYKETAISLDEEARRMGEAVKAARGATELPISADTQFTMVAQAALEAGADIINDVNGLRENEELGRLVAEWGAGMILMANDDPEYEEDGLSPAEFLVRLLEDAVARSQKAGISSDRVILDPGIGFFRHRSIPWDEWDIAQLKGLGEIRRMGYPVLVGASRKSFVGKLLGRGGPEERLAGSLAIAYHCALHRVEWIRAHDVAETVDVVRMAEILGR